jgi:hypothetical protein
VGDLREELHVSEDVGWNHCHGVVRSD